MSEEETFELLRLTVEIDRFGTTRYLNSEGQEHRDFGPAVIFAGGSILWHWRWRDLYHRVGGPATSGGTYFLFSLRFTKEDHDLECINKTMPQWKEYDEYIRARYF